MGNGMACQPEADFKGHFSRYLDGDANATDLTDKFIEKEGESDEIVEVGTNFCGGIIHDLKSHLADPNNVEITEMPINGLWDLLDPDGDGDVSWEEVAAALTMDPRPKSSDEGGGPSLATYALPPNLTARELTELADKMAAAAQLTRLPEEERAAAARAFEAKLSAIHEAYRQKISGEVNLFLTDRTLKQMKESGEVDEGYLSKE
mmetsp:Transcript_353/g.776  ORF Transcript_353/g.776 Transcript_353/m.776 type:complete len:205 (+) Transcript_353:12-626(+)